MTQTITRSDLADALYNELGFSHVQSLHLVDSLLEEMGIVLGSGEALKLSGFASFLPHRKKSRIGRNPRTGKEYEITPRTVISFRPSHLLRKALTGKK